MKYVSRGYTCQGVCVEGRIQLYGLTSPISPFYMDSDYHQIQVSRFEQLRLFVVSHFSSPLDILMSIFVFQYHKLLMHIAIYMAGILFSLCLYL